MFKAVIFQLNGVVINQENTLIPSVADLIKSLSENGIKLMTTSALPRKDIEELLAFHRIKDSFVDYLSESQIVYPNPSPELFYKAASLLKVKPEECLAIVSTTKDLTAADNAGMIGIGYSDQNNQSQDLSKAAILIEGFEELDFDCLKELYLQVCPEPVTILTTDRLILRELAIQDIPLLYEMYQNPQLRSFQYDYMDSLEDEIDKHNAYIKNIYRYYGFGLWGIFHKHNNQLIGRCGVELKVIEGREEYELGYMLATEYQGQGYAKEAAKAVVEYTFHNLHAGRVIAVIDQCNLSSLRLVKRLGMNCCKEIIRERRKCWLYEIINNIPGKGAGHGSNP